jgi:hypothetical protein
MKIFLRHLELILTTVGLVVVAVLPQWLHVRDWSAGEVAVATAVTVAALHGLIFWAVRERQRRVRTQTIAEVRHMLHDVVNNQLMILGLEIEELAGNSAEARQRLINSRKSVQRISLALDALSEESLRHWKNKYPGGIGEPGSGR